MPSLTEEQQVAMARQIAIAIEETGNNCAMIGATALAFYGYERATEDIDLAVDVQDISGIATAIVDIIPDGIRMWVRKPDYDDPLGGVITIGEEDEDGDLEMTYVQIINFTNPHSPKRNAAREGLASVGGDWGGLRVMGLPHLVALKLMTGGYQDKGDVAALLRQHPEEESNIRAICDRFNLLDEFTEVMKSLSRDRP